MLHIRKDLICQKNILSKKRTRSLMRHVGKQLFAITLLLIENFMYQWKRESSYGSFPRRAAKIIHFKVDLITSFHGHYRISFLDIIAVHVRGKVRSRPYPIARNMKRAAWRNLRANFVENGMAVNLTCITRMRLLHRRRSHPRAFRY